MRLVITAVTLGGALVLTVVACSSSTSSGPAPEVDGGGDGASSADAADASAPLPYPLAQVCAPSTDPALDACGRCARESCCNTRERIVGSDAGNALIDCMQKPSCDATCQAACFDGAPGETAPFLEHYACLSHRCRTECATAPNPCEVCTETNCLRESVACDLSRDCFVYSSCFTECKGVDACITECGKRYPGALSPASMQLACASNRCSRECQ